MTKLQKKIKTLLANWNESHTPLITNTKGQANSSGSISCPTHYYKSLQCQRTGVKEFLGRRSSNVELPSTQITAVGALLQLLQTISENSSFWRLKRLVTLLNYRHYRNNFIYLSM